MLDGIHSRAPSAMSQIHRVYQTNSLLRLFSTISTTEKSSNLSTGELLQSHPSGLKILVWRHSRMVTSQTISVTREVIYVRHRCPTVLLLCDQHWNLGLTTEAMLHRQNYPHSHLLNHHLQRHIVRVSTSVQVGSSCLRYNLCLLRPEYISSSFYQTGGSA